MTDSDQSQQGTSLPVKISKPADRALAEAGIVNLEQLTAVTEAELLSLHGMGPKGIRILREALAAKGLDLAR
ncbi:DNA-binding protein [Paenibacillus sp. MMS20-IR301]|uniref:DNA-binding protein n=1 Tax=Paenibacillus sp. MMS20-IR301 TaxID=2895946 RepID=UPI0028EDC2DA|nr:DNA-binding protein [Paenibacillus sp. MMS20-IR301]WNS45711.1 DNA-binding protein [Paenibacillus sp. MMS20-IR301]